MTDRRCKLGAALAGLFPADRERADTIITDESVRDAAECFLPTYGVHVGRESVRVHRAHECACYSLPVLVAPGEEAVRLSAAPT